MTYRPKPELSRAVLIGTSKFADARWETLPAVEHNLADLQTVLCDPDGWGLPPEHCTVLDNPAGVGEVMDAVQAAATAAEDLVLVYYAGHGTLHAGKLHLTLPGTTFASLEWAGVEYATLRRQLDERRAQQMLVLLDCCYSGLAADVMGDLESAVRAQISEDLSVAYVLTACARNEQSHAPPGERNTAFTGELLHVMRNGVAGADRWLTMSDIRREVTARLAARGLPLPQFAQVGQGNRLAIAGNRRWRGTVIDPTGPIVRRGGYDGTVIGARQIRTNLSRVYGPGGEPVRLVDGPEQRSAVDAPGIAHGTRSSEPGVQGGVELIRAAMASVRDSCGDGAATAALMATTLVAMLGDHGVDRRRELAGGCLRLAGRLENRLRAAARPWTDELAAAVRATAACGAAPPDPADPADPAPGGTAGDEFTRAAGVVWPDLHGGELVLDRPSVLVVDDDVSDASPFVRLPADRRWLVVAGRLGMSVYRTLQANVRGDRLAVVQLAPGAPRAEVRRQLAMLASFAGCRVVPAANLARAAVTGAGSVGQARVGGGAITCRAVAQPPEGRRRPEPLRPGRGPGEPLDVYEMRLSRLSRLPRTIEVAKRHGLLPGGGAALRWYGLEVARTEPDAELAELFRAVTAAPLRCLTESATDPFTVHAQLDAARGPSIGYHVTRASVTDLAAAGVLDPAGVVLAALAGAVSAGDRYVRQRRPGRIG